jgi:hypothetical protein
MEALVQKQFLSTVEAVPHKQQFHYSHVPRLRLPGVDTEHTNRAAMSGSLLPLTSLSRLGKTFLTPRATNYSPKRDRGLNSSERIWARELLIDDDTVVNPRATTAQRTSPILKREDSRQQTTDSRQPTPPKPQLRRHPSITRTGRKWKEGEGEQGQGQGQRRPRKAALLHVEEHLRSNVLQRFLKTAKTSRQGPYRRKVKTTESVFMCVSVCVCVCVCG